MAARTPIPKHLTAGPFTLKRGTDGGLSVDRMRGRDLHRPFRGVRSATSPTAVEDLCRAYQQRMPEHGYFCSVTAAVMMRVPLPVRFEQSRLLHTANRRPTTRRRFAVWSATASR